MRHISLYFQVHQPFRLRRYRFFDIGESNEYFDDYENKHLMQKIAERCYLPANKLMLELIKEYGNKFKISFSVSGTAIEQFKMYSPEVLESFKELAATGCVDFLAETYSHSLISLRNKEEFKEQIRHHSNLIEELFGIKPVVFRNTELIYDNLIGETVAEEGFKAMITEGAKHILGWKSPNVLYFNVIRPELKLILKNYKLSDDIAFRFSNHGWDEYPLTAKKYVSWIKKIDKKDETVNLFMDYETFGEHQRKETGIFKFIKDFAKEVVNSSSINFASLREIAENNQPVAPLNVPYTISWADEERDITAWLGNEMQQEAFDKLYQLSEMINELNNDEFKTVWQRLQSSDHFYYMSTKILSDGMVHDYFNPYSSSFDAFINFMNVLNDFSIRVTREHKLQIPESKSDIEKMIKDYEENIKVLKSKITNKTNGKSAVTKNVKKTVSAKKKIETKKSNSNKESKTDNKN